MHPLIKKAVDDLTQASLRGIDPQDPRAALKRRLIQDRLPSAQSKNHLITARQMQRKQVPTFVDAGMRLKQLSMPLKDPRSIHVPLEQGISIRDMVHESSPGDLPHNFPTRKDLPLNTSPEQSVSNLRRFSRDNMAHPPSSPAIAYRSFSPDVRRFFNSVPPEASLQEARGAIARSPGLPLSLKGRISRLLKLRGR